MTTPGQDRPGAGATISDVTLVVITKDRRDELLATLRRLRSAAPATPLLVLDNGSRDGSPDAVRREFPGAGLIVLPRNVGAVARNIGMATATTPYVAFADDDTWWEDGSLEKAVKILEAHPRLAVVTARIVVEPEGTEDPICAELGSSPLPRDERYRGPRLISFLAGASAVRRRALLAVGGFHERLVIGGEEELLSADLLCAGWAIGYAPELVVHHRPSAARDPDQRRAQGIRNTLWFTWLRRPLPSALRRTAALLWRLPRDAVSARGVAAALAGLPWVVRQRQPVPEAVERWYQTMDALQLGSRARRYVS